MSNKDSYTIATIIDACNDNTAWIKDHQKKSLRHSLYFGIVVCYILVDLVFYKL